MNAVPVAADLAERIREAILRVRREHPMRDLRSPSGNQFTAAVMAVVGPAIAAIDAAHDRRVTELLHANNRDVERRRAAERDNAAMRAALQQIGDGYYLAKDAPRMLNEFVTLARTTLDGSAGERVRHLKRGTSYGCAFR